MKKDGYQNDETKGISTFMVLAAWIVGFGFLVAYFSGMLDRKVNPNQIPDSVISPAGVKVSLKQNTMGHYVTGGEINGERVTFLLDTGATNVSVPSHLASRLGLQAGRSYRAQTANGTILVASTVINELKIGDITLRNVSASINPGMQDQAILLGMSALKQLEWSQRADVLTISTF